MPVTVIPWDGADEPSREAITQRLRGEGLQPSSWSNGPGDRYGEHEHAYHKVLYCVRGSIRFTLPGAGDTAGVDLAPGDRLELSAGTRHGAIVGPRGCECIEAPR
jgi:quercetin dioxygenase-like cupin family protein